MSDFWNFEPLLRGFGVRLESIEQAGEPGISLLRCHVVSRSNCQAGMPMLTLARGSSQSDHFSALSSSSPWRAIESGSCDPGRS